MENNPKDFSRIKGFITYLQLVLKSIDRGNYNEELILKINHFISEFYIDVRKNKLSLIKNTNQIDNNNLKEVTLNDEQIEQLKNIKQIIKNNVNQESSDKSVKSDSLALIKMDDDNETVDDFVNNTLNSLLLIRLYNFSSNI